MSVMRAALAALNDRRYTFRGTFVRLGRRSTRFESGVQLTALFHNLTLADGRLIADHVWIDFTKFQQTGLLFMAGDVVEFEARVRHYTDAAHNENVNLSWVTHVRRVRK